jgi:hypothetical protein
MRTGVFGAGAIGDCMATELAIARARRKTIKKRMRAKLLAIKIGLRRIIHDPIAKTGAWVKQMLKGI